MVISRNAKRFLRNKTPIQKKVRILRKYVCVCLWKLIYFVAGFKRVQIVEEDDGDNDDEEANEDEDKVEMSDYSEVIIQSAKDKVIENYLFSILVKNQWEKTKR